MSAIQKVSATDGDGLKLGQSVIRRQQPADDRTTIRFAECDFLLVFYSDQLTRSFHRF